ncbi:HNH endonuclease [Bacillus infantis]|uniref:HNH endonuclease n=2 Tax=Bacillus TaxID=1386 RepID=UPI003B96A437
MCRRTKWYKEFPSKGYRRRRSYCRECKNLYSFDAKKLVNSEIEVRIKLPSKRKISYSVSYEEAKVLVQQGMAGIVHETLIHKFYDKQSFKKRILERDNNTCFYCGLYGDTVDHIVPKIRGGISSFLNCVCACYRCNANKSDLSINDFLNCIEPHWINEQGKSNRVRQQIHYIKELFESLNESLRNKEFSELNCDEQISYQVNQIDLLFTEFKDQLLSE